MSEEMRDEPILPLCVLYVKRDERPRGRRVQHPRRIWYAVSSKSPKGLDS